MCSTLPRKISFSKVKKENFILAITLDLVLKSLEHRSQTPACPLQVSSATVTTFNLYKTCPTLSDGLTIHTTLLRPPKRKPGRVKELVKSESVLYVALTKTECLSTLWMQLTESDCPGINSQVKQSWRFPAGGVNDGASVFAGVRNPAVGGEGGGGDELAQSRDCGKFWSTEMFMSTNAVGLFNI
ncbi:hypothetical protein CEXT_283201 [Caerostris extrusa]|uniref:Uncharacterized protein n=1 Tax=Caerostris extrusa TaxID=172846 RepID=A0AAV4UTT5_CAEEX|nr:hypothetical protein CEXT_283201 [Caerostris extrusa]